MKEIYAELQSVSRDRQPSQEDDGSVELIVKINEGPANFLDRRVRVTMGLREFAMAIPQGLRIDLRNVLSQIASES